jgi:capsular polysaccharide biosynthesis protein
MNEINKVQDDEIDLFELFQTLWDGKWLISAFVAFATLIGFGYSQVAQPKYDVSVPHSFNVYSVSVQQICGSNIGCMEAETKKRLSTLLKGEWHSNISLTATAPLDLNEYQSQIEEANIALTNEVYLEATNELALIQNELTDALLGTERVATNMLNAKRIIQFIDNGQSAITFGSVSVVKSSPKVSLILPFSVVLGGMVGVFFILVRNAIAKRKEQLAKA